MSVKSWIICKKNSTEFTPWTWSTSAVCVRVSVNPFVCLCLTLCYSAGNDLHLFAWGLWLLLVINLSSVQTSPLYPCCIYFTYALNPIKAFLVLTAETCHPSRQKTWHTCLLYLFFFQKELDTERCFILVSSFLVLCDLMQLSRLSDLYSSSRVSIVALLWVFLASILGAQ